MGHQYPHRMGLRDRQLRVVDRYRACRYAHLRHPSIVAAVLAQLHQPVRRGHDAVCSGFRRHLSAGAHWPSVARLLDGPLPEHYELLAAIPQSAGVGRVCGLDLFHDLAPVLVHWTHPGFGHAARPRRKQIRADELRPARHGMARLRPPLGPIRVGLPAAGRTGHAPGALGTHGC